MTYFKLSWLEFVEDPNSFRSGEEGKQCGLKININKAKIVNLMGYYTFLTCITRHSIKGLEQFTCLGSIFSVNGSTETNVTRLQIGKFNDLTTNIKLKYEDSNRHCYPKGLHLHFVKVLSSNIISNEELLRRMGQEMLIRRRYHHHQRQLTGKFFKKKGDYPLADYTTQYNPLNHSAQRGGRPRPT